MAVVLLAGQGRVGCWTRGLSGSRKRISVSCERLRALLPRFDGRREDMASVLEMSVQFLRLAGTLLPSQEPHTVSGGGHLAPGGQPGWLCWRWGGVLCLCRCQLSVHRLPQRGGSPREQAWSPLQPLTSPPSTVLLFRAAVCAQAEPLRPPQGSL